MTKAFLTVLLIGIGIVAPASAADLAGSVLRLKGAASAVLGDTARLLNTGDDVFVGETITTGADTRLRLRLIDGAVITLGDHSTFTLQGYAEESQGPVFDVIQGVFLSVSGQITEERAKPLTVRTPLGEIGVRGTTFWGRQDNAGLQVLLVEGAGVYVEAQGRRVVLDTPNVGVSVQRGQPPTTPKPWGAERIERSMRQVAFD